LGFSEFQLVPVKTGDTRAKAYIEEHGDRARRDGEYLGAEAEALDLEELQRRVRERIKRRTDSVAWEETERLELEDLEPTAPRPA